MIASPLRLRLTYAVTPPNQTTSLERRRAIASAQSARLSALPIDAVLVYDVQDEAARNGAPRPFAYVPKADPLSYAFDDLCLGGLPRIVYRAVTQHDEASLCSWLDALSARGGHAVLVGAPSRRASTALSLTSALSLSRARTPGVRLGGVVIPERHQAPGTEDARVWAKMQLGCGFFVSQTVWAVGATKRLLRDLLIRAEQAGSAVPTILLTFSPCGSPQTLQFQQWLGVDVPPAVQRELSCAKDMLSRSIDLAADAFAEVRDFADRHGLNIGCNVESVSSRATEVEAAVELVRRIDRLEPRPRSTESKLSVGSASPAPVLT